MKLNKPYRRIIQFLTKNNEEKKQLIKENYRLQLEKDLMARNILHFQNQLYKAQNDTFRAENKIFELRLEIEKLKQKENIKETLKVLLQEIKNIKNED